MNSRRTAVKAGVAVLANGLWVSNSRAAESDWALAKPEDQGLAGPAVQRALDDGAAIPGLRSMLVARHGLLVAERYYGEVKPSDLLPVNSITKSVCSVLVGQALQQGKLDSVSQTVSQLIPEAAQRISGSPALDVTLGQILTGTTGLAYDLRRDFPALRQAADPLAYVLGLPLDGKPVGSWSYNDAAVSLLTPILEHAQGISLADLARRDLFTPLGISEFNGQADVAGHARAYTGLSLRSRDLLKLAAMVCNGGTWGNTRVLSEQWVAESTKSQVVPFWRIHPIANPGYGYLWFTGSLNGHGVAWAWGYGGQFALVVPTQGLSVVTLAASPPLATAAAQQNAVMSLVAQVVNSL